MTSDCTGCPFHSNRLDLSCFIFRYERYKSLVDFVTSAGGINEQRMIAHKDGLDCLEIPSNSLALEVSQERCINCMFCVFGCPGNHHSMGSDLILQPQCSISPDSNRQGYEKIVSKVFKGQLLSADDLTNDKFFNPNGRYQDFESFTSINETSNIAVWLGNTLKFLLGGDVRVSLEIPIEVDDGSRDGRLDVVGIRDARLISCETKTSFKDLMAERRFVSQMSSYEVRLRELASERKLHYSQYLVVGGCERDLLPPSDPNATNKLGRQGEYFYQLIIQNGIRFISAKAFLVLGIRKLVNPDMDLFVELDGFFKQDVRGLLTSGPVSTN